MMIILRMRPLMSVVRSHKLPVSLSVVRRYFILIYMYEYSAITRVSIYYGTLGTVLENAES